MQQYSKDRQLGKKTTASASTAARHQTPQGFWTDGDVGESSEPILEVSSTRWTAAPSRREPQATRTAQPEPRQEPSPPTPTPTPCETEPAAPLPTKDYPLRRLPVWVFAALGDLAQKRAKEAHLVQSSVNAEILAALEQYVIARGYRRDT